MRPYIEIEQNIIDHIKDIDRKINDMEYDRNKTYSATAYAELYKAKSLALQAFAELKNGCDGR